MISGARLTAFVASTDLARSEAFYVGVLGLTSIESSPFAVVVDGPGTVLRITRVEEKADAPYTVLGWEVDDIEAAVEDLRSRGVSFVRYEGMGQDDHDTWASPSGTRVAWFRDPDANTLSLQQNP